MILFFDTETTGKADFRAAPGAKHQPRLVQLGAILAAEDGKEMSAINLIIKPKDYEIAAEAAAIHGITTAIATGYGVDMEDALRIFAEFCRKPQQVVAHNITFDLLIARGEFIRAGIDDPFEGSKTFCTMHAMTDHCQLPGNYGDYKWPKLQEAHKYAFGKEFDGAHDANADVRACAAIYFWLKKNPDTEKSVQEKCSNQ